VDLPNYQDVRSVLLRRALQVHTHAWQCEVSADVTAVQFGVLHALRDNPGISQRDLGRLVQVDKSTMADIIARLRRNGYVTCLQDAADRRRHVVDLTEAGKALINDLGPRSVHVNELLFAGLGRDEARELDRLLQKLLASDLAQVAAIQ
jgi:MarR family transcriptional regulator, temperature-dependent positive regulator of motility